jgi:multiple sugar transport system substrate-binding protein
MMQDENLQPYVEGSLGRWFPVTISGTKSAFWQADPQRKAVLQPVRRGHGDVRIHEELQVHGAQQRERLGEGDEPRRQRQRAGEKATDEMIARIKQVAGNGAKRRRRKRAGRTPMPRSHSRRAAATDGPARKGLSPWQRWG